MTELSFSPSISSSEESRKEEKKEKKKNIRLPCRSCACALCLLRLAAGYAKDCTGSPVRFQS
jgi:hypothetical protein